MNSGMLSLREKMLESELQFFRFFGCLFFLPWIGHWRRLGVKRHCWHVIRNVVVHRHRAILNSTVLQHYSKTSYLDVWIVESRIVLNLCEFVRLIFRRCGRPHFVLSRRIFADKRLARFELAARCWLVFLLLNLFYESVLLSYCTILAVSVLGVVNGLILERLTKWGRSPLIGSMLLLFRIFAIIFPIWRL